jgi:uncharacterized protein (TIGR03435 family)
MGFLFVPDQQPPAYYSPQEKPVIRRVCLAAALTCATALGQTAKPLAFDVVSIRPSLPGGNGMVNTMNESDGYRLVSQPFWMTLMAAYFPQGGAYWSKDRLSNAPSWIDNLYDINAKISEADLAAWQKQSTGIDKTPMLRQMLQTMLADRCHLVAHFAPGPPISAFALDLGKHGPHFTESKPNAPLPPGMKLHDGGVVVPYFHPAERVHLSYYGVTMADLAQHLTINSGGHPVQDRTGLTGRYDFVLTWVDDPDSKLPAGAISANDPDPLSHWDINSLGLHLAPTKLPVDTLVVDHIEKPSEN